MSGVVSRMRRGLGWGLAAGVVLLMAGDHAQTATTANSAVDPFEILDLQVRANVIIVLDSSGSMREVPTASGLVNGINNGELAGDDPDSKLFQAKAALKSIVNNNKARVNFLLGRYDQTPPPLDNTGKYFYRTDDVDAANFEVNSGGDGNSGIKIKRNKTNDTVVIGTKTWYYLQANRFWNGETVKVPGTGTNDGTVTTATVTKTKPATVKLTDGAATPKEAIFTFVGANYDRNSGGSCSGFETLVPLAACTATAQMQFDNIDPYLGPETDVDANGDVRLQTTGPNAGQPVLTRLSDGKPVGIRTGGGTPIINSLDDIYNDVWNKATTGIWAVQKAKTVDKRAKTIIVFVTDGDDQCAGPNSAANFDARAKLAAAKAEALFKPLDTATADDNGHVTQFGAYTDPLNGPSASVDTFFIAFGDSTGVARANWIAWGGSGMGEGWSKDASDTAITWSGSSNAKLQEARNRCPTCRNATNANNTTQLENAIQDAIDRGVGAGEFSSQSQGSVTDSVFEYVALTGGSRDPLDPITRYGSTYPLTVRSTFQMPTFNGQLKAFKAGSSTPVWDAGQLLQTNVLNVIGTTTNWTFAQLHGGVSTGPTFIPSSTAKIRRRIFTTSRNGINPANEPLWPPTTGAVGTAPNDTTNYPAGILDGSFANQTGLAIGGMSLTDLQTNFKACLGSNLPADCLPAAGTTKQEGRSRMEAREIILAYTAGAVVVTSGTGLARNTSGELLYTARTWLLAESTIATPGFVGPPGELPTVKHSKEWVVYTDGPRKLDNSMATSNPIENGFGLRNPDRLAPLPVDTSGELEPVMTVVYVGANDMLHAFRAGPQGCTATTCPSTGKEAGGEELWGFVPYDLLPALQKKRAGQTRDNPTYMLSSSLRFGDIFIPGAYTGDDSKPYDGRWRTVMFFGRGPGGKYYTGLDITGPGPFTRKALETRLPNVLWNRGNPDTQDGTPGGTINGTTDIGVTDWTFTAGTPGTTGGAYATMGETWSVPALVPVDVTTSTSSDTLGKEWVLWVGSGFSDNAAEGRNFYTIDAVTGDIIRTANVGSGTGTGLRTNFLSSGVTGFVPNKLARTQVNAADGPATAAFVGDLHGRLFRFAATNLSTATPLKDFGTNQPIGVAVSALDLSDGTVNRPHVYGVTGNDNRIFVSKDTLVATPPFKMFGLRDDGGSTITELFSPTSTTGTIDFPERFRGSTQPLVANVGTGDANIVFFIGTQFDPAGTSPDATQDKCVSSFDSILFAVGAVSGNAAYDLQTGATDDRSAIWRGQKVQNLTARGGKVVLDTGLQAGSAPPPPPPPAPQSNSAFASVSTTATRYGSPVCKW
jgi:hypothetical protein